MQMKGKIRKYIPILMWTALRICVGALLVIALASVACLYFATI